MVDLLSNGLASANISQKLSNQILNNDKNHNKNDAINSASNDFSMMLSQASDNQDYNNIAFEVEVVNVNQIDSQDNSSSENITYDNSDKLKNSVDENSYSMEEKTQNTENRSLGIENNYQNNDNNHDFKNAIDKKTQIKESTNIQKAKSNKNKVATIGKNNKKIIRFVDLSKLNKQKVKDILNDYRKGEITKNQLDNLLSKLLEARIALSQNTTKSKIQSQNQKINVRLLATGKKLQKNKSDKSNKLNKSVSSNGLLQKSNSLKKSKLDDKSDLFAKKIAKGKKKLSKRSILNKNVKGKSSLFAKDNKSEVKSEIKLDNIKMKFNTTQTNNDSHVEKQVDIKQTLNNNRTQIFESIAKNTKVSINQGKTQFSTMFRPEEIGRVDLKFLVKDGKMNGKVILQSQEAADFFRSNVESLKAVFQKSNVEFGDLQIILAGQNQGENANNSNQSNDQFNNHFENHSTINIKSAEKNFEENSISSINKYNLKNNKIVNLVV